MKKRDKCRILPLAQWIAPEVHDSIFPGSVSCTHFLRMPPPFSPYTIAPVPWRETFHSKLRMGRRRIVLLPSALSISFHSPKQPSSKSSKGRFLPPKKYKIMHADPQFPFYIFARMHGPTPFTALERVVQSRGICESCRDRRY